MKDFSKNITKRGDKMKFTKRKDGRLTTSITTNGRKIYFYGKTTKEIKQKIFEYQEKKTLGRLFQDIAWEWWEAAEPLLSYQTRGSYEVPLKRLCEYFKDTRTKEIKPKDIQGFIFELVDKGYAQKTISNHKMVCNKILEYAIIQGEIEYNPCASVKLPKNLQKSKRTSATDEEEKIILQSANVWIFPFIALLTGMRKGEILALQWKDLNFKEETIDVTKSIYYEGNYPKIKRPKTETGVRTVPMLQLLKEKLLELKPKDLNRFIISDKNGNPISKKAFRWNYAKFQRQTGVKATAHQIRHSFATTAFESNVPAKSVQEILGHKQLSTTMDIYTDFRKKSFGEASTLLNKNFVVKK